MITSTARSFNKDQSVYLFLSHLTKTQITSSMDVK